MESSWGYHLIINAYKGESLKIIDSKNIENFVCDLVKRIDMVPYGPPKLEYFGKKEPKLAGWTVVQLIETSSIVGHFCDMGDCYLDIFSCKYFDIDVALECIQDYFNFQNLDHLFLTRQARRTNEH